jgi:hypothetical protein
MMMKFEVVNEVTAAAINSLKPVRIVRSVVEPYDRNEWMVYTPEGRLDDKFTSAGPFVSFDAARKNAEMNVGFTWKELGDALNGV